MTFQRWRQYHCHLSSCNRSSLLPAICWLLHSPPPTFDEEKDHLKTDYNSQQALLSAVITWLTQGLTWLNKPEHVSQSFHFCPPLLFLLGLTCPREIDGIFYLLPPHVGLCINIYADSFQIKARGSVNWRKECSQGLSTGRAMNQEEGSLIYISVSSLLGFFGPSPLPSGSLLCPFGRCLFFRSGGGCW